MITSTPAVPGALRALGVAVALTGGFALAVEGRVIGQFGGEIRDGVLAALVAFVIGLLLLATAVAATARTRAGVRRTAGALRTGRLRWWHCLGGTCGALIVAAQGITVTALGVAVFSVAVVAGQVTSSLVVDRIGVGPAGPQRITAARAAGALLAVVAVGVAVSDESGTPANLWLALLPALGGVAVGWQQAVNGLVRAAADDVVVATAVNFLVGTLALTVAAAVDVALRGLPDALPDRWWLYVGGLLGIVAVSTAVVAVRLIGVLLLGLGAVCGQLFGALLLDLVVPADGEHVTAATVAGVLITLVAVSVAALPAGRGAPG